MGKTFIINSLDQMCDMMCDNYIPEDCYINVSESSEDIYNKGLNDLIKKLKDKNKTNFDLGEIVYIIDILKDDYVNR